MTPEPMSTSPSNTNLRISRRTGWQRWFPLVWLAFMIYPVVGLFEHPRPTLEVVYGLSLMLGFALVFMWAFFWPHDESQFFQTPYRPPSLIAMLVSYVTFGLLWGLVEGNAVGLVIYAGSFAGFQRSAKPAIASIVIALGVAVWLGLAGAGWFIWSIPFFTLIAALGNHASHREMVARRQLAESRQEVERIAKIAERERIARDLHDLLGHTLSVIVLKSELASKLAERDPARATKEIREIERIARESLQEVRSAVRGYRSTGLEGELAGASLACEAAQIKLETYITPLELEWATEQTFSFVLREAVTNAIRYANAKKLWVSLERAGNNARLSIWDDGSGRITVGNGVRGMRERLEAVGGTLEINADHKGVTALLPLKHPEETRASKGALEGAS
jgi:two-component system, NarL family, sensor histidine kinase DesK